MAEYLRFKGFDIAEAVTGAEAREKVIGDDPDLVLLDLRLPDIAGGCDHFLTKACLPETLETEMLRVLAMWAKAEAHAPPREPGPPAPITPSATIAPARSASGACQY